MPSLKILHPNGDIERRPLTKQAPVAIGSHSSNDISLNEAGVEVLHCRIAWAKSGYEALAAGTQGIEVNGSLVQRAMLKSGDVLRFGTIDIQYRDKDVVPSDPSRKPVIAPPREAPSAPDDSPVSPPKREGKKRPPSARTLDAPGFQDEPPIPDDALRQGIEGLRTDRPQPSGNAEEDDDLPEEFRSEKDIQLRDDSPRVRTPPAREVPLPNRTRPEEVRVHSAPAPAASSPPVSERRPASAPSGASSNRRTEEPSDRLRAALKSRGRRPGEQDPLQSPLVLGLGVATLILAIVGAVFYMMAGRQSSQAEFVAAEQLYKDGKLNSAISALDRFAELHPTDPSADAARILSGLARVDAELETATPDYPGGIEQLKSFITARRELPGFQDQYPAITQRAAKVANGAAEAAGKLLDRRMLEVSLEGRGLLLTYSPKETPPDELLKQIDGSARTSESQILRHETFLAATGEIESALTGQSPMKALALRRDLLARYPEFAGDRKVTGLMSATLAAEKAAARSEDMLQAAPAAESQAVLPAPATCVFFARSRSDQVSVGEAVYVLSKDCLYGIDTITGAPLWRRAVGMGLPFFPLPDRTAGSLILFDTERQELLRLEKNSGKLLWRQPFPEPIRGQPLLIDSQLFLATEGAHLYRVELESGAITGRMTFSQDVTGPAALRDGTRLVVVGNQEVVYTLDRASFQCVAVSYLGHPAGSVEAPLLTMGNYVLAIQNSGDNAILRVLQADDSGGMVDTARTPEEVRQRTIAGRVLDTPVIRGRDLFVPSSGERVSAFSISDDAGEPPVTFGPVFQIQSARKSAVFLSTGPERQVWMAGSALRRLQLTPQALTADEKSIANGLASQPNQHLGSILFNARRRVWTDAVTLTQTDRDEMVSEWQAVLGARLLAWTETTGDSQGVVAVSEAGATFRGTLEQAGTSGFSIPSPARVTLSEDLTAPLLAAALPDGQLAVVNGNPGPKLSLINRLGLVERQIALEQPPQLAPIAFGKRIVVAMPGKLQIVRQGADEVIQDFTLPAGNEAPPQWRDVQSLDATSLVAVTETGRLHLIRLQTNPRPHLAEAGHVELGSPLAGRIGVGEGFVATAGADGTLRMFSSTLEPQGQREFPGGLDYGVWNQGETLFVEEGRQTLHAIRRGNDLKSLWTLPLEGHPLAGSPLLQGDEVVIARQNGAITVVDAATGKVIRHMTTPSRLASGPFRLGEDLYVTTLDGSFQRLTRGPNP